VSAVSLQRLVDAGLVSHVVGDATVAVTGVHHDSREVQPGDLFVVLAGETDDGARHLDEALRRGAVAVLAEQPAPDMGAPVAVVAGARRAMGPVASEVYGRPTEQLPVVGITGTNGKTTTAWILQQVLASLGERPALLGTLGRRGPAGTAPGVFTTPEADEVQRYARASVDAGATHLVMEVSSHGLALHRVDGVRFRVAAFGNLTQDHLDFHGDMDAYGAAKARLFLELVPEAAVINVDDAFGATLAEQVGCPLWRCSRRGDAGAQVRVASWTQGRDGMRAHVVTPGGALEVVTPLVGAHNLDNLLMVLGVVLALGLTAEDAAKALAHAGGVPGRLERVEHPGEVAVFVDYAHTPDALSRVLSALRSITPGRLVVVFGCGGDRDRTKREPMGRAAGGGADLCVLTSDNPRTENPARILADAEPGLGHAGLERLSPEAFVAARRGYAVVSDRREAIDLALRCARPGDTVLIAGKGHEDYQIVGTERLPFDDRIVARGAISALHCTGGSA
jgi:UDP-N-acetylmuramoyl-L-alanyl-D-glutamate--2,6-diaminopimelate ligase